MAIRPRPKPSKPAKATVTRSPRLSPSPPGARSLAEKLLEKHRGMGIPAVKQPFTDESQVPQVPDDITTLSDRDLSTLYGRLDAFAAFVGYHLAKSEVDKLDTTRQLKELEAEMLLRELADTPKGKVTQTKMEVSLDPQLRKLRQTEAYHVAETRLLKTRYDALEQTIRVLSREQSRREVERGRRSYNKP